MKPFGHAAKKIVRQINETNFSYSFFCVTVTYSMDHGESLSHYCGATIMKQEMIIPKRLNILMSLLLELFLFFIFSVRYNYYTQRNTFPAQRHKI